MLFKDAIKVGKPKCLDCVYFDNRILKVIGSNLIGVNQSNPQGVTDVGGDSNGGYCRHDPPGPIGWITIVDGSQTYCGKWDDGNG